MEMHGCVLSTVLQHQGISIHSDDQILVVLGQFHTQVLHL